MSELFLENKLDNRISMDDYFMQIADLVSTRASCIDYHFGAVIVKDKQILATGYNGAPAGLENCLEIGSCRMRENGYEIGTRHESCRAVHAEQNAIIQCARHGISCKGATLYINGEPCRSCSKMIINSGINRVIYKAGEYKDRVGLELMKRAGIEVISK